MNFSNKTSIAALLLSGLILFSGIAGAEETDFKKFGSLSVYSRIGPAKVYVNNDLVGETPVEIEKLQVGTHLVAAAQNGKVVFEEVAKIVEGEITTIVLTGEEKRVESEKKKKEAEKKAEPALVRGGPYLKVGFIQSLIYSRDHGSAFYASAIGYGGGYKISFLPSLDMPSADVFLSFEKGDFASGSDKWFLMPITLGLTFNYPIIPGFGGKQYMSIGLGYLITNIRIGGEELSCVGYSIVPYGIDFPVSEDGAVFFEVTSSYAENGRFRYVLETYSIGGGFRWML